jgi:hypothetical protein
MKPFFFVPAMAVLALLSYQSVQAGDRQSSHRLNLATPLLIHGGAQALDHFSTRAALARGGREIGPIAGRTGPNAARLLGGAAFLGADVLAQHKGKRWLVWTVRIVSVGVGVYAAKRNGRVR